MMVRLDFSRLPVWQRLMLAFAVVFGLTGEVEYDEE